MRLRKRESRRAEDGGEAVAARRHERDPDRPPPRASRTRNAGAAAAGTVGAGAVVLALFVITLAVLVALLIGLAILLADVGANTSNTIVKGIHESANFFAGSFTDMIRFTGHPKRAVSVNWGPASKVGPMGGVRSASLNWATVKKSGNRP